MANDTDKPIEPDDQLIVAVGRYMRSRGWVPLVAGPVVIRQQVGAEKLNFEVVIKVTAHPPKGAEPKNV
jgi:hypothetical protein